MLSYINAYQDTDPFKRWRFIRIRFTFSAYDGKISVINPCLQFRKDDEIENMLYVRSAFAF